MVALITRLTTLVAVCLFVVACSTEPSTEGRKTVVHLSVRSGLDRFTSKDPGINDALRSAYGYAIFGDVGEGALGIGGAWGRGEVYEQNNLVGYATITKANVGLQAGGQSFNELLIFQTKEALDAFKAGHFAFDAGAKAVAVQTGAAAQAKYNNHVMVFVDSQAGLEAGIDIGAQAFSFKAGSI